MAGSASFANLDGSHLRRAEAQALRPQNKPMTKGNGVSVLLAKETPKERETLELDAHCDGHPGGLRQQTTRSSYAPSRTQFRRRAHGETLLRADQGLAPIAPVLVVVIEDL